MLNELPKLLTAAFAALLAWLITQRVTASWDLRKKRNEFDLLLVKDFYELVGHFKAVAREAQLLSIQPAARPAGTAEELLLAGATLKEWNSSRALLAKRSLDIETKMEAVLLKLVSEGATDEGGQQ